MEDKYQSALHIMQVHVERINLALAKVSHVFPLSVKKVSSFNEDELVYLELLTSRFAKLQDYLGKTLFSLCLERLTEYPDNYTLIDKVNLLVKYNIVPSEELWLQLRASRNHIAHEYPGSDELTAKFLNECYELIPGLLTCADNIKNLLSKG